MRYIKIGQHEILRRIYVAVRDRNWETIEAHISIQHQEIQPDSFFIRYRANHQRNDVEFVWDGVISGDADGALRFSMDGKALSTFWRNRIGFCVLHPMSCAGASCIVEHIDGTVMHDIFPVEIAPHQPFQDMQAITHVVEPGLQAEVRFRGDTFEMEDQRNWTDASYKTYCTPLKLPFPVEISAGRSIQQSVELRLIGNVNISSVTQRDNTLEPVRLVIGSAVIGRLPRLGLCEASHNQPLSSQEIKRLRGLNLSHLRVDIYFSQPDWEAHLRRVVSECEEVGVALEAALHLTSESEQELQALRRILNILKPRVGAWLLFDENGNSAPTETIALAHHYLGEYMGDGLFGGGTDAFFAQLNRNRPLLDGLDLITYSLNPQVHAFDNSSLIETLPAQMITLASARRFSGGRLLMVSPVTLRMRFNPAATSPDPVPLPHILLSQVDPRQMSLFGAAWTLGSIKYLAEGGAHSVTYYETTGWLGVMETDAGSLLPDQFPSLPGSVFPMYHVLADMGAWASAEVLQMSSTDPLTAVGMTLRSKRSMCVLIANFSARQQTVQLNGLRGNLRLRMLDEFTAQEAMTVPEIYRARPGQLVKTGESICSIELAPFAVANISIEKTKGD
ncbi:MAG: hypothetical protein ABIQ77_07265 [Anaerolineales bacterium]